MPIPRPVIGLEKPHPLGENCIDLFDLVGKASQTKLKTVQNNHPNIGREAFAVGDIMRG